MKNRTKKLLALLLTLATCLATFAPMMAFAADGDDVHQSPLELWSVDFNDAQWKGTDLGTGGRKDPGHNGFRLMNAWDKSENKDITSKSYAENGVLTAIWNGVSYTGGPYERGNLDVYLNDAVDFQTLMKQRNTDGSAMIMEDFTFSMSICPIGDASCGLMSAHGKYYDGTEYVSNIASIYYDNGTNYVCLRGLTEKKVYLPSYEFSTIELAFDYDGEKFASVTLYVNGKEVNSAELVVPTAGKDNVDLGQQKSIRFFRMFDSWSSWTKKGNGMQFDYMKITGFKNNGAKSCFDANAIDPRRVEKDIYNLDFEDWEYGRGVGHDAQEINDGFRLLNVWDDSEFADVTPNSYVRNGVVTALWHGVPYNENEHFEENADGTKKPLNNQFMHGFLDLMIRQNKLVQTTVGDMTLAFEVRMIGAPSNDDNPNDNQIKIVEIASMEGEDEEGRTDIKSNALGYILSKNGINYVSLDTDVDANDVELSSYKFSTIEVTLRYDYETRSYTGFELRVDGVAFKDAENKTIVTPIVYTSGSLDDNTVAPQNTEEGDSSSGTTTPVIMNSIRYFRTFYSWHWTREGVGVQFDSVRISSTPDNVDEEDYYNYKSLDNVTSFVGYQTTAVTNGNYDVRLLAIMNEPEANLKNYKNVGFKVQITARDTVQTAEQTKLADKIVQMPEQFGVCNTVYGSVVAADGRSPVVTYTAEDFGGNYIFAVNCLDMSTSWAPGNEDNGYEGYDVLTFTVTTYYTLLDGTQVKEKTFSFEVSPIDVGVAGNGNWTDRQDSQLGA